MSQVTTLEEDNKSSQSLVSSLDINEERQNINASHIPSLEINERLQLPCQILCDQANDRDLLGSYDIAVIFEEIQEHSENLTTMDNNKEKQFSPILFKENQFQHITKRTVCNEVCFPILNHPEDLMLHNFHDPLVSSLQSLVKRDFSRFINATIGSSEKLSCHFFNLFFRLKKWKANFSQVSICLNGCTRCFLSIDMEVILPY